MSQSKQQQEIDLFLQYQHAISNLDQDRIEEGKEQLKYLLRNPILQDKDSKGILYGIYLSLAEILGRSNQISEKCDALLYYHLSNQIIENCWQTHRKMSIIFRQLGLIPRAFNLTIKALQACNQTSLQPQLLYQACCLCFIMNEPELFLKYSSLIPNEDVLKKSLLELEKYQKDKLGTPFVQQLLDEQAQIQHKLSQIPQQQLNQEFFQQQYDCEIPIDVFNLNKFFKKIKNIFKSSVVINNEKLEVHLKDQSVFIKTSISVKNKNNNEPPRFTYHPELLTNKESQGKYFRIGTNKQQNAPTYADKIESFLQKEYQTLTEIISTQLHFRDFDFFNQITYSKVPFGVKQNKGSVIQEKKNQENQVAKFLVDKLHSTKYLTIIHLLNALFQLLFLEYIPKAKNNEAPLLQVQRELIKCVIWAQFSVNQFTDNPIINLELLDLAVQELSDRIQAEKFVNQNQKIKSLNFQLLIRRLKQQLLETDIKPQIKDSLQQQIYFKKYYRIMALLHNDNHLFTNISFKQDIEKIQETQRKKMERLGAMTIEEVVEEWRNTKKKIKIDEKIQYQISWFVNVIKDFAGDKNVIHQIKQIINVCIKQLYFGLNRDEFLVIKKYLSIVFDAFYKVNSTDYSVGLLSLKIALIFAYFQYDNSKPLNHFFKICLPYFKFPAKQLIEIEILKIPSLNYHIFFVNQDLNIILRDFLELRIKMKEINTQLLKYFFENFEAQNELIQYLLQFVDENIGIYPHCVIQLNPVKIEAQLQEARAHSEEIDEEVNLLREFSSESEEEFVNPELFFKQYKTVKLNPQLILNKFTIISKTYQYPTKKREFLLSHMIQINMGDPGMIKQIKKFTKEALKQKSGITTRKVRIEFAIRFFNNYYLSPDFKKTDLSDTEFKFIGYYLPLCFNQLKEQPSCQQFLINVIRPILIQKIDPIVVKYADQLFLHFCSKQSQKQPTPKFKEMQDQIKNSNLLSDFKASLCYMIFVAKKKLDFKFLCLAIAHNEIPFFWNCFYMEAFDSASDQFLQKSNALEQDWFICQKKIQVHLHKNPFMAHLFEYRFIMDLLKAQQRQIEYQLQPNEKSFQKIQQAYQFLLQQNQLQIPNNVFELQYNFRAMLLIEKKILRKYRSINIARITENIDNYLKLNSLIYQMKKVGLKYYYNSHEGEIEIIQDLYINIYKYVKRFIRHQLHNQLNQLIGIVYQKLPQLFGKSYKDSYEFTFPVDQRKYKIPQFSEAQIQEESQIKYLSEKTNIILNNLNLFFSEMALRLNKKYPQRYAVEAVYYSSHIAYHNTRKEWNQDQIFKKISTIYQQDSKDIILYYKNFQNSPSEIDIVLQKYYNHNLIFEYQKSKILKLVIKILFDQLKWKELLDILEKLTRQHEIRIYQICIRFLDDYQKIEDAELIKEILCQIEISIKNNPLVSTLSEYRNLQNMYLNYYDKECLSNYANPNVQPEMKLIKAKQSVNTHWHNKIKKQKEQLTLLQSGIDSQQNMMIENQVQINS